jgi:predicted nucleic acid-binding protein
LGDACSKAKDHADFLSLVAGIRASSRVKVVSLDSGLMRRGLELMRNRPDKDWSLADCISFVVMEEMGLREALTGDRHFEQAGFKALLA